MSLKLDGGFTGSNRHDWATEAGKLCQSWSGGGCVGSYSSGTLNGLQLLSDGGLDRSFVAEDSMNLFRWSNELDIEC